MKRITDPLALVRVRWLSPNEGGRRDIPPGPLFAATAVFRLGKDEEVIGDWPAEGEHFSVLLEFGELHDSRRELDAIVEFMHNEAVYDLVRVRTQFLLMEGARPIADVSVLQVSPKVQDPQAD